jgi:phage-related protein
MAGKKRYWTRAEYCRLIEILDDYWLTQKDEKKVDVIMLFEKKDGQEQIKHFRWHNPDLIEDAVTKAHEEIDYVKRELLKVAKVDS